MIGDTLPLDSLPGVVEPPVCRAGVWHVRVTTEHLVALVSRLLDQPSAALLLVTGDDRLRTGRLHVHYLVGWPNTLVHVEAAVPRDAAAVPTLAARSFPATRFEREMRDLLGVTPVGHPDPRPLVRHGFWPADFHPLRQDAVTPVLEDDGQPFPFTPVEGAGIYEIPVGPVHAGVIEPGHFRFSVLGETIVKMRARLYFTHKGTERLFAGRMPHEGLKLAERISGDTSVGHALAYCQALESLTGAAMSSSAAASRTVLLELERLYNHVTDAGAIIADTGFAVGQAHCLRLREAILRLNKAITGHRLLRGGVVPGGVGTITLPRDLVPALRRLLVDFEEILTICADNTLVRDRLDGTGRLPRDVAVDFGVVGYVARACGIARDVRADLPFAAYGGLDVVPVVEHSGDVYARLQVRVREVRQSVGLIERALGLPFDGPATVPLGTLPPYTPAFGVVEAWRGRLVHMVIADDDGRLHRVKVVDPSFLNWPALARTLEDNIVPDFPLCNKSFNLSYSGNDV